MNSSHRFVYVLKVPPKVGREDLPSPYQNPPPNGIFSGIPPYCARQPKFTQTPPMSGSFTSYHPAPRDVRIRIRPRVVRITTTRPAGRTIIPIAPCDERIARAQSSQYIATLKPNFNRPRTARFWTCGPGHDYAPRITRLTPRPATPACAVDRV